MIRKMDVLICVTMLFWQNSCFQTGEKWKCIIPDIPNELLEVAGVHAGRGHDRSRDLTNISDVLQALNLDPEMCCGFRFDGASVLCCLRERVLSKPDRNP